MFDAALRNIIDPPLNAMGTKIAAIGVSANTVTVVGFLLGMLSVPFIATEYYSVALILIVLNRVFDGLDGAVARHSLLTNFGGYLDIVCDFIFYAAVVFGFALARPENALYAAFLIFSFMGTGSSFLTYAIMAEKYGISTDIQGRKSLYYLGGLAEGGETIAAMLLMCVFPDYFLIIALVFGAMCWITTVTRIYAAWLTFGKSN
ncbi:CDP-alcohol phosphatidyltransferase family protein [Sneathiella sp. CAU 1612]|uniref:CDP-alcohol phosphatidyltransferase family protein n=1 Tax=Sneathiella sedimenti TaxID=2816034 RepID=A0ABS3F6S8_9PROT|nr:CDP-alcohol phosphatidyltransferase family protein [Sneathiella sedimenti]MBO0334074.1 CDP-alcohol phosphatidyltransferase family protein [Sneathiella sedimenti]